MIQKCQQSLWMSRLRWISVTRPIQNDNSTNFNHDTAIFLINWKQGGREVNLTILFVPFFTQPAWFQKLFEDILLILKIILKPTLEHAVCAVWIDVIFMCWKINSVHIHQMPLSLNIDYLDKLSYNVHVHTYDDWGI